MIPTGNFLENIHNEQYEQPFHTKPLTHLTMIADNGREKEPLSGYWHFQVDWYDSCLRSRWFEENYQDAAGRYQPVDYSFDQWEKTPVPSCWNVQAEKYYYYEGPAVYTRTFKYVNKGEQRVFIKFGAANYEAKIFLNKKYIGFHKGGSTPFFAEVTGLLQEINRLLVVVDNTRKTNAVPCRNTDWFNYGGLYREVELIRLPGTFIKDWAIHLEPDSNFQKIRVKLTVDGEKMNGEALLAIPELNMAEKITVVNGCGAKTVESRPELWSPENPKLYDVTVAYAEDRIDERIGFREIKAVGTEIFLNGVRIFLKGVSCHEESVINGKAVTEAEIIENYRLAKEMNCNFMRLAHYPHSEKAARIADKIGIMLWEEIPVYWAIDFANPETYRDAENQLLELIKRDQNRASVIIWSVGNENADSDARLQFMSSLAKTAQQTDPSRLVSAACLIDHINSKINDRLADFLDIIGINEYYGWYDPDFEKLPRIFNNSQPNKPVIITEFGADALPGARGTADDLGTEDCQLAVYKRQVSLIQTIEYIQGTTPWILFDFRCPRRANALQNGYNTKGLLSADKQYKKPAFYIMQDFYAAK
jgi:beta-glucuronidase